MRPECEPETVSLRSSFAVPTASVIEFVRSGWSPSGGPNVREGWQAYAPYCYLHLTVDPIACALLVALISED